MFFQAVRGFTAQRSGAEILFLAMTQILTVVVVGALVSRSGYYVSRASVLAKYGLTLADTIYHWRHGRERGMLLHFHKV